MGRLFCFHPRVDLNIPFQLPLRQRKISSFIFAIHEMNERSSCSFLITTLRASLVLIYHQIDLLEKNLKGIDNINFLPSKIASAATEQVAKFTKDGISTSHTQNAFNSITRFMAPTEKLAMGLSRLDPYHIAPVVLGGVFSAIQLMNNETEGHRAAVKTIEDLLPIMTVWSFVDDRQIRTNRSKSLATFYDELRTAIIGLFRMIMILLGRILAFLSNKQSKYRPRKSSLFLTQFFQSLLTHYLFIVTCVLFQQNISGKYFTLILEQHLL